MEGGSGGASVGGAGVAPGAPAAAGTSRAAFTSALADAPAGGAAAETLAWLAQKLTIAAAAAAKWEAEGGAGAAPKCPVQITTAKADGWAKEGWVGAVLRACGGAYAVKKWAIGLALGAGELRERAALASAAAAVAE